MKAGTPEHPKMLELADALGVKDRRIAVATLELLIHFTRRYAIQGDVGRWSNGQIAQACLWPGDPSVLIGALQRTRWLDVDSRYRLVLHDWHDHADDSTKKVVKNRGLAFIRADGQPHSVQPDGIIPDANGTIPASGSGQVRSGQAGSGQAKPSRVRGGGLGEQNGRRATRAAPLPPDFTLTEKRRAFALAGGLGDVELVFGAFRDHHLARGTLFKDWEAGWRKWCRKELEMRSERQQHGRR